nr:hypothetical protein [Tanacetum cinerariifolium]
MTTLAEFMIVAGGDNRPPMLDKTMYDSWESCMELYIEGKENGRMMLNSIKTVYLSGLRAANIVLQGLPPDVYSLVNHHRVAKDIWDRVKLLMQGTSLSKQEQHPLIPKIKQPFKMVGLQFNKFRETSLESCWNWYSRKCSKFMQKQCSWTGKASQTTILKIAAFQTEDLDAYDSYCDDVSSAKAVLMENLSCCDSDVLSEESQDASIQNTNSSAP